MSADKTPTLADHLSGYHAASSLLSLLEAIAAELRKTPLINKHSIRVLPEYAGDLMNSMNAVINKQLSMLVMVTMESASAKHASLETVLRNVGIAVHVYESVLINQSASGTRVPAITIAESVLKNLHGWQAAATNAIPGPSELMMQPDNTLRLNDTESNPKAGMICYTARLHTMTCLECVSES